MILFIDSDANPATGRYGYDYLVDRTRDDKRCSVERNLGQKWLWEKSETTPLRIDAQDLVLEIPRSLLGVDSSKGKLKLDFKWDDNIPDTPEIMSFYQKGDAAPGERFNYRFAEQLVKSSTSLR